MRGAIDPEVLDDLIMFQIYPGFLKPGPDGRRDPGRIRGHLAFHRDGEPQGGAALNKNLTAAVVAPTTTLSFPMAD
eukprot:1735968-Pyramimonas_sp.AAC.2